MPATRFFKVKRGLLRWAGATIGSNVRIVSSAKFYLTGQLIIGDNTWIGHEVLVVGGDAPVCIGKNVDIAPRVNIITGGHQPNGIKLSIIDKPAWAAAPRQPDAFAQSSCLV